MRERAGGGEEEALSRGTTGSQRSRSSTRCASEQEQETQHSEETRPQLPPLASLCSSVPSKGSETHPEGDYIPGLPAG